MSEKTNVLEPIPAPRNKAIEVCEIVLDNLVEGVGVDATIAAATTAAPFLGTPVVRGVFRWSVEFTANFIDERLMKLAIKAVINIQSKARKKEFNASLLPIIAGSPTPEEIKRARDAADRLIERNR